MFDKTGAKSLLRGIQSVLFLYLSCAPCLRYYRRKQRRKQNKVERQERQAIQQDIPHQYRHPSPSRTNPYWAEEIRLGPGPPPKRTSKKTKQGKSWAHQAAALQAEENASQDSSHVPEQSHRRQYSTGEHSTMDNVRHLLKTAASEIKSSGEKWNSRRYQREDEELWTSDEVWPYGHRGLTRERSSVSDAAGFHKYIHSAKSKTSTDSFYVPRNPPLNDLHPPIVSNPATSRISNRWMLQPPPPPSVMNGYRKATESSSSSGVSNRKARRVPMDPDMTLPTDENERPMPDITNGGQRILLDDNALHAEDMTPDEPQPRENKAFVPNVTPEELARSPSTERQEVWEDSRTTSETVVHLHQSHDESNVRHIESADSGIDVSSGKTMVSHPVFAASHGITHSSVNNSSWLHFRPENESNAVLVSKINATVSLLDATAVVPSPPKRRPPAKIEGVESFRSFNHAKRERLQNHSGDAAESLNAPDPSFVAHNTGSYRGRDLRVQVGVPDDWKHGLEQQGPYPGVAASEITRWRWSVDF